MTTPERPLPDLDAAHDEVFWRATSDERFLLQSCDSCGSTQFYPGPCCRSCGSDDWSWTEASGRGTVATTGVVRRATEHAWFEPKTPYVVAYVELEGGPLVCSNVVECDPDAVETGLRVAVSFDHVTESLALPHFKPTD